MRGVRILEKTGFYIVEAGGRTYRLPKAHVEKKGDTILVSRRTGYRFRSHPGRPANPTPATAEKIDTSTPDGAPLYYITIMIVRVRPMGCEKLSILIRLERDIRRKLARWPDALKIALEIIEFYKTEVEEELAEPYGR